jgi:hypothetical protein
VQELLQPRLGCLQQFQHPLWTARWNPPAGQPSDEPWGLPVGRCANKQRAIETTRAWALGAVTHYQRARDCHAHSHACALLATWVHGVQPRTAGGAVPHSPLHCTYAHARPSYAFKQVCAPCVIVTRSWWRLGQHSSSTAAHVALPWPTHCMCAGCMCAQRAAFRSASAVRVMCRLDQAALCWPGTPCTHSTALSTSPQTCSLCKVLRCVKLAHRASCGQFERSSCRE